jgi:hypothetical protein
VIYGFKGCPSDGAQPITSVVFDKAGNLYGTAGDGGTKSDWGIVCKLTLGAWEWKETIVHRFNGGIDVSTEVVLRLVW